MNPTLTRKAYSEWTNRAALLFILAIAAFLLAGHGTHLLAYSGYLLFFTCILMHLFMHGGHSGHGNGNSGSGCHSKSEDGPHVHNEKAGDKVDIDGAEGRQDTYQHKHGQENKQ